MHTNSSRFRARASRCAIAVVVFSLVLGNAHFSWADFLAIGDVTATIPFPGPPAGPVNPAGGPTGDLIVGDTAIGGLLGDGVAPLFGFLSALESDNVIVGNTEDSIGAVNIEDFIGGPDGNWTIADDLVVGHAGLGFFDLLNASGIGNAPSAAVGGTIFVGGIGGTFTTTAPVMGNGSLGEGIIRVNGLGSRLQGQAFVVGGEGVGLVEASGRSSINTLGVAEIGSTGPRGDGTVRLTDLGTRWAATAPVTIGGLAGASHGKVQILNEAVFQLDNDTTGPGTATLTVNPRGRIELTGGTVRIIPRGAAGNEITNNGVISGGGFIDGGITIGSTGELRNAAGVANQREILTVAEVVTNAGLIESIGGEMLFENAVTNTSSIVVTDAIMRFKGMDFSGAATDLDNSGGTLILGDHSTVYGTITGPGTILATGLASIFGDIAFGPSPLAAASAGDEFAALSTPGVGLGLFLDGTNTLTITGDLDLAGVAALAIDYVGEAPIEIGDMLPALSVTGSITGAFSSSEIIANGRMWDVDIVGDDVLVTAGALISTGNGDFDGDGDVDGADFLAWQRDPAGSNDLSDWLANYPPGSFATSTSAVPEPSTLLLTMLTLVCFPRRSRS